MTMVIEVSKLSLEHPAKRESKSDILTRIVKRQFYLGIPLPRKSSPMAGARSAMFGQRLL